MRCFFIVLAAAVLAAASSASYKRPGAEMVGWATRNAI